MAQGGEHDLIIGNILMRMAKIEAKEKDLRTVVTDGFAEMRDKFAKVDTQFQWVRDGFATMNHKFKQVDDQIDLLATEMVLRTDRLEKRMDKIDGKLDRIMQALAI